MNRTIPEALGLLFVWQLMTLAGGLVVYAVVRDLGVAMAAGMMTGGLVALGLTQIPVRRLLGSPGVLAVRGTWFWMMVASVSVAACGVGVSLWLPFRCPDEAGKGAGAVISVVLLAPWFEELIFRGVILRKLLAAHPAGRAILMSAVLFMLMHGNPAMFPHTLAIGLLFGWVYARTRSLWPSLLGHFALNAMAMAAPVTEIPSGWLGLGLPVASVSVWMLASRLQEDAGAIAFASSGFQGEFGRTGIHQRGHLEFHQVEAHVTRG